MMDLRSTLIESKTRGRRSKAAIASLVAHGALLAFVLFMSARAAHSYHAEVKPMRAFLSAGAAPPPPPPPPPASGAAHPAQTPKVEMKPIPVEQHFVQPLEIPKEIPNI